MQHPGKYVDICLVKHDIQPLNIWKENILHTKQWWRRSVNWICSVMYSQLISVCFWFRVLWVWERTPCNILYQNIYLYIYTFIHIHLYIYTYSRPIHIHMQHTLPTHTHILIILSFTDWEECASLICWEILIRQKELS